MWRFIGSDTCRLVDTRNLPRGSVPRGGTRPKRQPELADPLTINALILFYGRTLLKIPYCELSPMKPSNLFVEIDYFFLEGALDLAGSISARCNAESGPACPGPRSSRSIVLVVPMNGEFLIGLFP